MIELHEGEFCRTKSGFIAKLIEIDDDGLCWFDGPITESGGETYNLLYPDEIDEVIRHYTDIRKALQEGDYINGLRISYIEGDTIFLDRTSQQIFNEPIKNIVTKEQFLGRQYEVKGDD